VPEIAKNYSNEDIFHTFFLQYRGYLQYWLLIVEKLLVSGDFYVAEILILAGLSMIVGPAILICII
jgi:hypothetical protein